MKVMFICTGNTCRSAMAEAILKDMLKKENRKDVEVYSCGIFASQGETATRNSIEAMKKYNIDLSMHRATNIKNVNLEEMDLILCATANHKIMVQQMYPQLKLYTIKEYANSSENDLADPWGNDQQTYDNCAKEISNCIEQIIKKL